MKRDETRVRGAARGLLDALEAATEELRSDNGVDRAGLKVLVGVLKDLQDILARDETLETKERLAKIQKLQLDMEPKQEAETVTVVMEGDTAGFAG